MSKAASASWDSSEAAGPKTLDSRVKAAGFCAVDIYLKRRIPPSRAQRRAWADRPKTVKRLSIGIHKDKVLSGSKHWKYRRDKIPARFLATAVRLKWTMPVILSEINRRYHMSMSHRTVLLRMGDLGIARGLASEQFRAERARAVPGQMELSLNKAIAHAQFGTTKERIIAVKQLRRMGTRLPLVEIYLASLHIDLWSDQYCILEDLGHGKERATQATCAA
jgi:hypothetical protein